MIDHQDQGERQPVQRHPASLFKSREAADRYIAQGAELINLLISRSED